MKITILLLLCALFAAGCYTRRSEPFCGKPEKYSARIQHGEQLFAKHCDKCHPSGEYGLGLGLNPVPAPKFLIAFQIRTGLGTMPPFKKDELTRQEVRDIIRYMKALKHNKKDKGSDLAVAKR